MTDKKECGSCKHYDQTGIVAWPSQCMTGKYTLFAIGQCRHPKQINQIHNNIPTFYHCIDFAGKAES